MLGLPGRVTKNRSFHTITKQYVDPFRSLKVADWEGNRASREILGVAGVVVPPDPVPEPVLMCWAPKLAEMLGMEMGSDDIELLAGNRGALPDCRPVAAVYAGHQFGSFAGQLGDGRAITLGAISVERCDAAIQLKGSGRTPLSRSADGRAVFRSSVREILMAEYLAAQGVPSVRGLSLVLSGEGVPRDEFYDGRPRAEPGAVVARVAPSFARVGSLEVFAWRKDGAMLREVFADVFGEGVSVEEAFSGVVRRTAYTVARWLGLGAVQSVFNSDNCSLLGLTIDIGPFGFMETYDPEWTPNRTDRGGYYSFQNQAMAAKMNMVHLAGALYELEPDAELLTKVIQSFDRHFAEAMLHVCSQKLGMSVEAKDLEDCREWVESANGETIVGFLRPEVDPSSIVPKAIQLWRQFLDFAAIDNLDFTNAHFELRNPETSSILSKPFLSRWQDAGGGALPIHGSPEFIPRGYQLFAATREAEEHGNMDELVALASVLGGERGGRLASFDETSWVHPSCTHFHSLEATGPVSITPTVPAKQSPTSPLTQTLGGRDWLGSTDYLGQGHERTKWEREWTGLTHDNQVDPSAYKLSSSDLPWTNRLGVTVVSCSS